MHFYTYRRVPPLVCMWKKLLMYNFLKISKRNPKKGLTWTFLILKGTKSWKISPIRAFHEDWCTIINQGGSIWSPPCRIGLSYCDVPWNQILEMSDSQGSKKALGPFVVQILHTTKKYFVGYDCGSNVP